MATVKTLIPKKESEEKRIRVAAYCRVSTDSADQKDSFDAQVEYYTSYIGENPDWTLADIYADQGITGTSMTNRDEFNRMIADCRRGKIDRIHKREQEVLRAIDYATDDYEKARQMILECAREKYRIASQGRAAYDKLQSRLTDVNFQINRYTVAELIRRIRLLTDDEIEITLINGQTLNKEQKDGTD